MNRRKFLENIGKTVLVAPIAATTIQEAAKVQQKLHDRQLSIKDIPSNPRGNMNIDSNYPEFFMSWDDPDGIYVRKSVKDIWKKK